MTSLDALLAGPVVHRLGWTLLHSLWQIAFVALLLWIVLLFLKRRSASSRYLAGCLSLVLMAALPTGTLWLSASQVAPPEAASANAALPAGTTLSDLPGQWFAATTDPTLSSAGGPAEPKFQPWHTRLAAWLEPNLRWIVAAWLAGVCVLSLRIVAGWIAAQRLRRRCCATVPAAWQARFAELAGRIGVSRPVQLLESSLAQVPTVIGHIRPVILLPISALTGLAPQQLEAILAHELAHIRRHDYLVNLVQVVIETLLFYHPAAWWVSRRIRIERENCCDDIAVDLCGDRFSYIRALVSLEESRADASPCPRLAVAWQGTSLLDRARRLIGGPAAQAVPSGRWMAAPVFLAAILVIVAGLLTSALALQGGQDDEKAGSVGAAASAPASAPALQVGREDADMLLTTRGPHWERYSVGETRRNKDGQEVTQLVVERPTEFGANKGKADKNGRDILVQIVLIQAPVGADLAAAAKAVGKSQSGRVGTWKLYPGGGRALGNQEVLQDAISPAFLSAEQVQKLGKEAEAKGWTVLTRPTIAVLEWQDAWVEVHTMLTDVPLAEQNSGTVSRFDVPSGPGIGVQPRILTSGWIEMDLLVRFAQVSEFEEPTRGGRIGVIEGGMRGMASVRDGETMLMRVPTGRASMQCYRKRVAGSAKEPSVEVLMEPIEGGEPLGPVYVLITPRILKEKAATRPAPTEGDDASQAAADEQPGDDINAQMAQLDISNATLDDIRRIFGEPISYTWDGKTLDRNALRELYTMTYPSGMQIHIHAGRIREIRFEGPSDYAYRGLLRFGSTWQDVVQLLGEPGKTVQDMQVQAGDSVLYKDFRGYKGLDSYWRRDLGLIVGLRDGKVVALFLMPTQPPAPVAAFSRDALGRIDQVQIGKATRDDVVQMFGKPDSYWWDRSNLDENNLPWAYLMQYPGGLTFMVRGHCVDEIRIEGGQTRHPMSYAFRGSLRVGGSMQDALNVLGQPTRIVDGGPLGFEDGVLYKNAEWQGGKVGYYSRSDQGVRMWFTGDRVLSIYLTRTEPADDPVQAAGLGARLSRLDINTTTSDDLVRALGKPARYMADNQDVDEANLPQRYLMSYPNGVRVAVDQGQVMKYHFSKPTSYAYKGILRIGSTMDEVKQVLGEPKQVVDGRDRSAAWEDGVLYTDCEGMGGQNLYMRNDLGVRVILHQDRVAMMMIARPQAGQGTTR